MTKNETITIKKVTVWQIISGILAILLVLSYIGDSPSTGQATRPTPSQGTGSGTQVQTLDGARAIGAENPTVTIVKYNSFSCGFCDSVRPTIRQILETYPEDVQVVVKHFDRGGSDSMSGQAMECAGDQGQWYEMYNMLFDRGPHSGYSGYARDLGLDVAEFDECMSSQRHLDRVRSDTNEARQLGFSGTPSFTINNEQIVGAQPFANFQRIIEAELQ
ncbi:MAG: DsbA family protein [Candidatus Woesearchaeota archaeon]